MKKSVFIIISLLLFINLFFSSCGAQENGNDTVIGGHGAIIKEDDEKKSDNKESDEKEEDDEAGLYIVCGMNPEEETITLLSLKSGTMLRYSFTLTTQFYDEYKNHTSWSNFTPGQVVEIGGRLRNGALSSVSFSDKVWREEGVSDYKIDTDLMMLRVGGSKYHIPDDVKVFSNDVISALEAIGENDVLKVIGQEKKILTVSVVTGHGFIQLINAGIFDGSLLMVGKKIVTPVYEGELIEVPEGSYDITAASKGYGDTKNYSVERNRTVILDMNELLGEGPKLCNLTFTSNVPEAEVYIDGERIDVSVPHDITYGSHKLLVSAEGYESWNKTLVVNSPTANISLTLTEEDTASSGTSGRGASSSSDSGGSSENTEGDEDEETGSESEKNSREELSDAAQAEVDYLTTMSSILSQLFSD